MNMRTDEFLKFYLALIMLEGILGIVHYLFFRPPVSATELTFSPVEIIFGLVGVAAFILSIVAWIRFAKRKYSKFLLITPIVRIFLPIVVGITSAILSVAMFSQLTGELNNSNIQQPPTTEQLNQLNPQIQKLALIPLVQSIVMLGLGVWTLWRWRKLPKQA